MARVGVAVRTLVPFPAGVDVAVALSRKVNLRAGFNMFTLSHDFDNDGINIAAKLKLSGIDSHLDWYPGGGSFHISPGLLISNNIEVEGDATVTPGTSFDLGDATLFSNAANPVTGKAHVGFDRVAPSILIGWGNVLPRGNRRWSIPFEFGVIYSKAPVGTLTLSGSACTANGANCRNIAGPHAPERSQDRGRQDEQGPGSAQVHPGGFAGIQHQALIAGGPRHRARPLVSCDASAASGCPAATVSAPSCDTSFLPV